MPDVHSKRGSDQSSDRRRVGGEVVELTLRRSGGGCVASPQDSVRLIKAFLRINDPLRRKKLIEQAEDMARR